MGSDELGELLRELRRKRGFSRLALSDEADVSTTYIAQIESGIDPRTGRPFQPSPGVLRRLALALARHEPGEGYNIYAALMAAAGYLPQEVEAFSPSVPDLPRDEAAPPSVETEPFPSPFMEYERQDDLLGSVSESLARQRRARGHAEADLGDLPLRAEVAFVLRHWNDLSPGERAALYAVARLIIGRHPWASGSPGAQSGPDDETRRQGR